MSRRPSRIVGTVPQSCERSRFERRLANLVSNITLAIFLAAFALALALSPFLIQGFRVASYVIHKMDLSSQTEPFVNDIDA